MRALTMVTVCAALLSASLGCAHSLSLRLDRLNAPVGSENVQSLRAAGVDMEMLEYPGVGHKMLSVRSQLRDDLISWAQRKHL
jgi:hypothetical protein